ncbi:MULTISPECIES: ParB/RepB/Spo0J family partition protein [Pseudomonadota]|jgi:ParB family chromosome partitioning protein|uniref:ParB/RepB/Spo0J family partition protein n=1 Tax=Advenella alkanexedens TaxID=1481665 RepID=A0ABS6NMD6_9BURK|nr:MULTISPECIES: ParB/RepB/Spo0J family partition protein [Advenella]MBV4396768.1 ParB/RepB/Spo0J family partition protein [Advenella alkanexedens]MDD3758960.1 ParB/RepB/Spo0J family partition protein [Advenella sp.]NLN68558.1 ParB/RepB/Spo0J family partition protein [Alcaligenaceae bacterium]WKU19739.1 ParB/RepB/Spo0J family partition protein [Advenella alkanexedens]
MAIKPTASKTATKAAGKTASKTAVKKTKGLGRGLAALLGNDINVLEDIRNEEPGKSVQQPTVIQIGKLQAGKYQPRTRMDEGALTELADSIKTQGIMQPILVRPLKDDPEGKFEIIAGERRYRAAILAGLKEVPVLVREVADENAAIMALIENIQREDLNPLEEAQGVKRLIDEFSFTHEQAAQAIGRSRSLTSNLLRLLNLAEPVQTMLLAGDIDMGHARALLAVDAATQILLANQVIARSLSVRETEKLVKQTIEGENKKSAGVVKSAPDRDLVRLEEALSDHLGTKVVLKVGAKNKGQLMIDFHSWEHLNSLLEKQGLSSLIEH